MIDDRASVAARLVARLLLASLLCMGAMARADTSIALFKSYAGNVGFTGTQKTLRTKANGDDACALVTNATTTTGSNAVTATLSGIPAGSTILNAYLYWAGSGTSANADFNVTFEGSNIAAARSYTSLTDGSGAGDAYFSGVADVTAAVAAKGNGNYTFSHLTVDVSTPYCSTEGVLAGISMLVIYSNPAETYRVLNLYEGFQYVWNSAFTLNVSNFKIPSLSGGATGKIGHITWEGDPTLTGGTENLTFNGVQMTDALNPVNNQFNSVSNINNDSNSYGIDFDAYALTSPTIQSGQTTATTTYSSGQDLVLVSAEIVAVPNVPVADMSLAMTLENSASNTALTFGQDTWFSYTVANNGPSDEIGPIVITDTLPAIFTYTSGGGNGWTCGNVGQVVTCTYAGALAVGASLPTLTVGVTVTGFSAGTTTNTALVSGQDFDNVAANNTASKAMTESAPGYVFTDALCKTGLAFGNANQTCHIFPWNAVIAGADTAPIFITAVNASGVPTQKSGSASKTVPMQFGLACINPTANAGIVPTFNTGTALTLHLCTANGATPTSWPTAINMVFAKTIPSASASGIFNYADVGKVEFFMNATDGSGSGSSGGFVVKPTLIFKSIYRTSNPATSNPAPTAAPGAGFVKANEPFTVIAAAVTATGTAPPNFGKETPTPALDYSYAGPLLVRTPAPAGTLGAIVTPTAVTTAAQFTWDEVGILSLTPTVAGGDYLGAGALSGAATNVGRFYPDHYTTSVAATATYPMMNCPGLLTSSTYADCGALKMVYATQGIATTVTAYTANNDVAQNFTPLVVATGVGGFSEDVTLSGFTTKGGAVATGALTTPKVLAASFFQGVALPPTAAGQAPSYAMAVPFSAANPHLNTWTAPTYVYMRASDADGATSLLAVPANSVEGGALVVNGRLLVSNGYGSELLPMAVPIYAQFYDGNLVWRNNSSDSNSSVTLAPMSYTGCIKGLAGTPCKTAALNLSTAGPIALGVPGTVYENTGGGVFRLRAPGANNNGSVDVGVTSTPFLPTTRGHLVFGIDRSPVIYLREVY